MLAESDFTIFAERSRWPQARSLVFIAEAADLLADTIWSSDDEDLEPVRARIDTSRDVECRQGILWTMVNLFSHLLIEGQLSAYARPVDGAGTFELKYHAWDRDDATRAVATGRISLADQHGAERDHWIFLDEGELDILLLIHSPAGADPTNVVANLRLRHDRMAELLLCNLRALVNATA